MLAVSPLRNLKNEREVEMEGYTLQTNEFGDFTIDFDELFVGISDGDVLPYLEMDPEIFAEFSVSAGEESEVNMTDMSPEILLGPESGSKKDEEEKLGASSISGSVSSGLVQGDETVSKREQLVATKEGDKARKSTASSKNLNGKRKVKVDWTPELHRRFVQAVEQLGVDKAVPSRILELMGIDCLTRHNVASHLQKYRSHRKHLLAREAEAASWSQRRQMYDAAVNGRGKKDHVNHNWIAPTLGFPPVTPMTHFRPLHVWGHPSVDQSLMHLLTHPPPPPPPHAWPHHPPPHADHSFWISPHHVPVPTPGTPCFPPHLQPTRYPAPPVPGLPPPAMYKADMAMAGHGIPKVQPGQALPRPPSDVHPSKESVDAAIGDVLSKPWLPLPLGLKPPSVEGVMVELQRQGISKIPPTCA